MPPTGTVVALVLAVGALPAMATLVSYTLDACPAPDTRCSFHVSCGQMSTSPVYGSPDSETVGVENLPAGTDCTLYLQTMSDGWSGAELTILGETITMTSMSLL